MIYAQIDEAGTCIAVTRLKEPIDSSHMIPLPAFDEDFLGRTYEAGEWSATKTVPAVEYQPTNAEVAQMISDLQADLLIAGVIE